MRLTTWNVNGIRARAAQVETWLEQERPDVLCLQEIKAAPSQVPMSLAGRDDYWSCWHGAGGYSGVAILVRRDLPDVECVAVHPAFDFEQRVASVTVGTLEVMSVYVPNGGKDYDAKLRFLQSLGNHVAEAHRAGRQVVVSGDLNVARTDRDLHPKERKPNVIGQLAEERELFEQVIGLGLVDVHRALHPDADDIFTWWAPWRNLRARNIGWRIDYVLASESLAATATRAECLREFGTSDHAPLSVDFGQALLMTNDQ
jgi:exodeoxyribonuclease-3